MARPTVVAAAALASAVVATTALLGVQTPANATSTGTASSPQDTSSTPTSVIVNEQTAPHAKPILKEVKVSSKAEANKVIADATATGKKAEVNKTAKLMTVGRPRILPQLASGPADPRLPGQWGMTRLNAADAWNVNTGAGQIVAVIDSGVDATHEDLAGATVLPGTDFISPGGDARYDGFGHGTMVAGIVAAHADNGLGGAGLAPDAKILPIRVFDDNGNGGSYLDISNGITWAADHGANIINMSLGGTSDSTSMRDAISYAQSKGVLIVASAGNEFDSGNPVEYPAAIPGVVAVGATDDTDAHAYFSEAQPYVSLAAPGVDIVSTGPDHTYQSWSGTSFSAPFVSAAAAMVRAANPGLTPDQIAARLTASAQDLGAAGQDDEFGYGLVDPVYAMTTGAPRPLVSPPSTAITPATIRDLHGKLTVFATTSNATLLHGWQSSPGTGPWGFTTLAYNVTGVPAVTEDVNHKLVFFARTTDGRLIHGWQNSPGSGPWLSTTLLSSGVAGDPTATKDVSGKLVYIVRMADGSLMHGWQNAPGSGPWLSTTLLSSGVAGDPTATKDVSGKLVYIVRMANGSLMHGWQNAPGSGPWLSTTLLGSGVAGDPAVTTDVSGKLVYMIRMADGSLMHGWQNSPGSGPWYSTTLVSGNVASDPATALDVSGKLVYFVGLSDGSLLHGWQGSPGTGPWASTVLI